MFRCYASCVSKFTLRIDGLDGNELRRECVLLKRCRDQEVSERRRVEQTEDRRLHSRPDSPRQTHWLSSAAAWQVVLGSAVHRRDFALEHAVYLADSDRLRLTREPIAAAHAARPLDQAGPPQLANQLLEVCQGQTFASSNFGDGQQPTLAIRPSQLGHCAEPVVDAGRHLHNSYLFTRNYAVLYPMLSMTIAP